MIFLSHSTYKNNFRRYAYDFLQRNVFKNKANYVSLEFFLSNFVRNCSKVDIFFFKSAAANNGIYSKCILIKLYVYIYKCIGTKCQWSLQVLLPPIGSKKNHDSTLLEH